VGDHHFSELSVCRVSSANSSYSGHYLAHASTGYPSHNHANAGHPGFDYANVSYSGHYHDNVGYSGAYYVSTVIQQRAGIDGR
jgi:hypothetical protein